MRTAIDELLGTIEPPSTPVGVASEDDWRAAETRFGVRFPDDHKAINRHYGVGWFDGFIFVLGPLRANEASSLLDYTFDDELNLDAVRRCFPDLRRLPLLHLVPIAWTINGDELFYLYPTTGNEPPPILIIPSRCIGDGIERHRRSLSELLALFLRRTLRSTVFPHNFPSKSPRFSCPREPAG